MPALISCCCQVLIKHRLDQPWSPGLASHVRCCCTTCCRGLNSAWSSRIVLSQADSVRITEFCIIEQLYRAHHIELSVETWVHLPEQVSLLVSSKVQHVEVRWLSGWDLTEFAKRQALIPRKSSPDESQHSQSLRQLPMHTRKMSNAELQSHASPGWTFPGRCF